MKKEYKAYKADLWGNSTDGYDVNDWYPNGIVELNNAISDQETIQELVDQHFFNPIALKSAYRIDGEAEYFFIEFYGDTWQETYKFELIEE